MKVPKYIKEAVEKTAKANFIAYKNSEIVRNWLEKYNLEESYLNEVFIDCCEYGTNNPQDFIEELENYNKSGYALFKGRNINF